MLPVLPGILSSPIIAQDWDSLVYTGNNKNISGQVMGLHVSQDGAHAVTVDINSIVRSYTLSSPGDITTLSASSVIFDASTQDADMRDIAISPDGLTMFLVGLATDAVYEYTMATPYDTENAVYSGNSWSTILVGENAPSGLDVSPDGTKMIVCGTGSDDIHQLTLGTSWSLAGTVTDDGVSLNFSGLTGNVNPQFCRFVDGGSRLISIGSNAPWILYGFELPGTAYTLTGATLGSLALDVTSEHGDYIRAGAAIDDFSTVWLGSAVASSGRIYEYK